MFDIEFYNLSKKDNSTKRPSGAGTVYNCNINAATGILNPVIGLGLPITEVPSFTYCYIAAFKRYYFVSDWRWAIGIWEADLTCDVLATYKTDIGGSTLYVTRAASDYNEWIPDTLYPVTGYTITKVEYSANDLITISGGYFVVGVVGRVTANDDPTSGITYMVLSPANFKALRNKLFSDELSYAVAGDPDMDSGLEALGDSLVKLIFDPFEYIVSVNWVPVLPAYVSSSIYWNVGFWVFTVDDAQDPIYILDTTEVVTGSVTVDIPVHPQIGTVLDPGRGKYLYTQPFSIYTAFIPGIGTVPLDGSILARCSEVKFQYYLDPQGGTSYIRIMGQYTEPGQPTISIDMGTLPASYVVPIALTSGGATIGETASAIVNTAVAAISGTAVGAIAGTSSVLGVLQPQVQQVGKDSGKCLIGDKVRIQGVFYFVADEDNDHHGRPLCQEKQINTLSGYIECLDGDLDLDATPAERTQIQSYLEGGFFYE